MPVSQLKKQCDDGVVVGAGQEMFEYGYRTLLMWISLYDINTRGVTCLQKILEIPCSQLLHT
jgi:hypothetical protein